MICVGVVWLFVDDVIKWIGVSCFVLGVRVGVCSIGFFFWIILFVEYIVIVLCVC